MGINIGQVISDVNSKTGDFKGINVPVILKVDSKTKNYTIEVLSPPTSELLKKELGITKASSNRIQIQVGNIAMERVIFVAKQKHNNMLSTSLLSSIKSVLGTCQAMGVLVEIKKLKKF
jgi:large subunit ribosomal protein L11